jgi:hypothetical protein
MAAIVTITSKAAGEPNPALGTVLRDVSPTAATFVDRSSATFPSHECVMEPPLCPMAFEFTTWAPGTGLV